MNEEYFIRKEYELKQKVRNHKAKGYLLKKEIDEFLKEKEEFHTYYRNVIKLTEEELNKKIKQVKTMLNKSKDQSASENEREVARKRAERMIKKYGIKMNDFNKNESKVNSSFFGSRHYNDNYDTAYDNIYDDIFNNRETTVEEDLDDLENDVFSKDERDKMRERKERGYW